MEWIQPENCITTAYNTQQQPDENVQLSLRKAELENGHAAFLTAHLDSGLDGQTSFLISLPQLPGEASFMAIENHSPFWCRPVFGCHWNELPEKTQMLLSFDGQLWHCWLPLCGDTFKTLLIPNLMLRVYSNMTGLTDCCDQPLYVYMTGSEPLTLVREAAKAAAKLLKIPLRSDRTLPEVFTHLGWCSWDALHIHINHKGLLEKASEFHEKNVPLGFAILDDMWANAPDLNHIPLDASFHDMVEIMHASSLDAFEGDPVRFPQGMQAAIDDLKEAGIPRVGVWFPTTGYWAGFSPDGPDARELAPLLSKTHHAVWQKDGALIVKPEAEAAQSFFRELCRRIHSWHGDFVKIDNQGFHSFYQDMMPIGQSAAAIQQGIDQAAFTYFDGAVINCMGMPSECMFHRPFSAVSRCSDDFIPESRDWFAKNILQCAYNGLLQGQFYINDWDMWWTDDEQASKNSLCRAISGGPVYVSDPIGRTRPEILRPLIFADGTLPLCDESATPTADCLLDNPTLSGRIFKVRNRADAAGLVAIFNIDSENRPVTGSVCPEDAELSTGTYAWYEHFTAQGGLIEPGESIPVALENRDEMRLYTFLPADSVTLIGRSDLFIGTKAVLSRQADSATLYEGGDMVLISPDPVRIFTDTREVPIRRQGDVVRFTLKNHETQLRFQK